MICDFCAFCLWFCCDFVIFVLDFCVILRNLYEKISAICTLEFDMYVWESFKRGTPSIAKLTEERLPARRNI